MKLCPPGSIVSEGGGKQLSCGQFSMYCILCRCGGLEFQQKEDGGSGQSYLFQEIGIQDKPKKIKYKFLRLKIQMIRIHFGSEAIGYPKSIGPLCRSPFNGRIITTRMPFVHMYNKILIHYSFVIIVYVACIRLYSIDLQVQHKFKIYTPYFHNACNRRNNY